MERNLTQSKGVGRPTNRERYRAIREALDADLERVAREHLPEALTELVRGHYREVVGPHGVERIYRVSPNIDAIREVLNRVLGKPVTQVELSGPDGSPLESLIALVRTAVPDEVEDDPSYSFDTEVGRNGTVGAGTATVDVTATPVSVADGHAGS